MNLAFLKKGVYLLYSEFAYAVTPIILRVHKV